MTSPATLYLYSICQKREEGNAFLSFLVLTGREPIKMQVSGGHLPAPVQKLVPSSILFSR